MLSNKKEFVIKDLRFQYYHNDKKVHIHKGTDSKLKLIMDGNKFLSEYKKGLKTIQDNGDGVFSITGENAVTVSFLVLDKEVTHIWLLAGKDKSESFNAKLCTFLEELPKGISPRS